MSLGESLVRLGLDFVPVPVLGPAFSILNSIWRSVQKAANNKQSLRNLAVSSTDVFKAVNFVLAKNETSDHIRDLLLMFEKVLEDIRDFSAEHVATNVFMILIKNVDIEGKTFEFQTRLQNLSMAFNIAAYGDIRMQLAKLLEGQQNSSLIPSTRKMLSSEILLTQTATSQIIQVADYKPQRVKVTHTEFCYFEIRNNTSILASRYDTDVELSKWGIGTVGSTVSQDSQSFDIVSAQGDGRWKWSLTNNRISSYVLNPAYPDWNDSMDIIFAKESSAVSWFSWLQAHASATVGSARLRPPGCEVTVRTICHFWIQKTPNSIQHRRSTRTSWLTTLGGHSQSARAHSTHFTYISANKVAFAKVYRSGDTIIHERSIRAENEDPTTARRFQFETELEAEAWYAAWKRCAMDQAGENEPTPMERTFVDPRTIQMLNRDPILGSALWPEIRLRHWGMQMPKSSVTHTANSFTVACVAMTWTWIQKDNQLTISTAMASRPDWFHSFELVFRDAMSAKAWFTYLRNYCSGDVPSLPPCAEHVSVKEATICWMQNAAGHIQIRTALSDSWINHFGMYKRMDVHQSHLAIASTSILPYMRIAQHGCDLIQTRSASVEDLNPPVSRIYRLPSEREARTWYEAWRENLRTRIS